MPSTDVAAAPPGLRDALTALLQQLPQAQAVALMGFDGLPVMVQGAGAGAANDPLLQALPEYAQAWAGLRRAAQEGALLDGPSDLVIHGPQTTVLIWPIHPDYYLGLVMGADAAVGRARFFVRLALPALRAEL